MDHKENNTILLVSNACKNKKRLQMMFLLESSHFAMASSFVRILGISQPSTSKHLKVLMDASLITKEKVGSTTLYSVNKQKWNLVKAINCK